MDMETSLSAQVLEAIPPAGATWGDIKREFPKLAPWTLDATIKGLVDSKLIRRTVIGDMGAFVRAEFVIEPLDGERDDMFEAREREMLRKARKKRSVAGKRRYGDGAVGRRDGGRTAEKRGRRHVPGETAQAQPHVPTAARRDPQRQPRRVKPLIRKTSRP